MFLIDDNCFTEILGGEFYQVIVAKKLNPDISVYQLFNYQFKYDTYVGFLKFYRKHLEPIIDGIRIVKDDSINGKAIRFLTNFEKENRVEKNK
jgi:hypothetical protein